MPERLFDEHDEGPWSFQCPLCKVMSNQRKFYPTYRDQTNPIPGGTRFPDLITTRCDYCNGHSLWMNEKLIYPLASLAPEANTDMPPDVRSDFDEARNVLSISPRSAAALLRLALQKLLPHLGGDGKNIDKDIGTLVKNGLPAKIQKAMDSLRVIGNNAVHPGQMDLKDDAETANKLFMLLNYIVEQTITQPKHLEDIFDGLPQGAKDGIAKRDSK
jgi:hypothetical protein